MRIGLFDSGIGGLTVLREVRRHCRGHSTVYLGDTARVPYGTKSPETVEQYALQNAEFLLGQNVDILIVACNTASAWAMKALEPIPIPALGVIEPGAKLAVDRAGGGLIGVLGTAGTIDSGAYERAIHALAPSTQVASLACPMFVPLAEEGWVDNEIAAATARIYLEPWTRPGAVCPKTVILGCTHYPVLKATIQAALGRETQLIDSAQAVALDVAARIEDAAPEPSPEHRLYLTDASENYVRLIGEFLGSESEAEPPHVERIDLRPVA